MIKKLRPDVTSSERAVSPVVGTVTLVAVVVILAAVVGGFVLGQDNPTDSPPQTIISIEHERIGGAPKDDALVFQHEGGATFSRGGLSVLVGDDKVFNSSTIGDVGGSGTVTETLDGLVVQVDPGPFNDLNKPGPGPPGDAGGDSRNVVNQWGDGIQYGDRLVIQERNASQAYDVINRGDTVRVIWRTPSGKRYVLASTVVGE